MPDGIIPVSAVTPGRYLFRLPDWTECYEVEVEESTNTRDVLTVRHVLSRTACQLKDIPLTAQFIAIR